MLYSIGDLIVTKKPHACGSGEWTVIRVGADFKIKCKGCGRIVMLSSDEFKRAVKKHLKREQP